MARTASQGYVRRLDLGLLTPKPLKVTSERPRTPTSLGSSVETLSSIDWQSPTTAALTESIKVSLYTVSVERPVLPVFGPVFFPIRVRDVITGEQWSLEQRYSSFAKVHAELNTTPHLLGPEFPPKTPAPGRNLDALALRAANLQTWSLTVLQQPEALRLQRCGMIAIESAACVSVRACPLWESPRHECMYAISLYGSHESTRVPLLRLSILSLPWTIGATQYKSKFLKPMALRMSSPAQ